jgi:hypothetical protein
MTTTATSAAAAGARWFWWYYVLGSRLRCDRQQVGVGKKMAIRKTMERSEPGAHPSYIYI